MFRGLFLIGTTAFWLVMTTQLIRQEYFQISTVQTPLEIIPITTTPIREDYKAIYLGERQIGFEYKSLKQLGPDSPEKERGAYELYHNSYMAFLLLGERNEMLIQGQAWTDDQLYLKSFKTRIKAKDYWTQIEGKVLEDQIEVTLQENNGQTTRKNVPIAKNERLLYSEILENIWTQSNLRVGKQGRFRIFNPLLLSVEDLNFRVDHKEIVEAEGKKQETFVVVMSNDWIETRSWINHKGVMIRKENPNGLVLASEPGWEIFETMRKNLTSPPDLPNLYSIPSNKEIPDIQKLKGVRFKITSPEGEQTLNMARDSIQGLESFALSQISAADPELAPFLTAENYVQSDDPVIQAKAREIAEGETSVLKAAQKIMAWVHTSMKPLPTAAIPSAAQVLTTLSGDCNEYAVLFTALARAAGIPTKIVAGVLYHEGRFFYHAWAGIYAGRWVALDPTLNQIPLDLGHIPLAQGGVEDQVNLANKIGRIKIFILSTEEE